MKIPYIDPEERNALMDDVESQTVPDDVETAEDMLFGGADMDERE